MDGFFLESIAPARNDESAFVPGQNEYQIDLRLPSGLSLRRSFQRSEIERRDTFFDTGIAEVSDTSATISLGEQTAMSFTRSERVISDVFSDMLEQHTTTGMQFQQRFGGGEGAGMLTLSRALQIDRVPGEDELRTLLQSATMDTGLGTGMHLTASVSERQSEESEFRLQETDYRADLAMALSGGQGTAHYRFLDRMAEGRSLEAREIDLVAPFAIQGGTAQAEHHLREQITDSQISVDRSTSFAVPLDLVARGASASYQEQTKIRGGNRDEQSLLSLQWAGASASYQEQAKVRGGNRDEKNVLTLTAPLRLFGRDASLQHVATETLHGGSWQDQRVYRLSMQFTGGPGVLEHTETLTPAGEGVRRQERLRIQTPRIHLADVVGMTASQVRDRVDGTETSRVSHIALTLKPWRPMDVSAGYTLYDRAGKPLTEDRDIRTVLTLSPHTRLQGSILEQERLDGPPVIVRHLELQRQAAGEGDLAVRFGFNSYGEQQQEDTVMLAQLNVGQPTRLGLSATYAEYDERKNLPLAEPTTTVEVRAGDPARMGMRAAYRDQAGRPEPERTIGVALGALGGSLRIDFINNPLDPRGKQVMLSDVYELGFRRTVFGGVNMDFGYRYFLPQDEDDTEHFFKLQLDGGDVARGGRIALSYLSGHFVPYPRRGQPPASLLDLTYEKRWPGDEGRLLLTLSRREAPVMSVGIDDNIEAEVRYQTQF